MNNDLSSEARSLEDAFFLQEDQRLLESLREMKALEVTTGMLAEVSGIQDPALLDHLARLQVTPAAAASLAILPLIEVAWADGTIEANERQAILKSLDEALFFQTIDRDIVEVWLEHAPPAALFSAWETYARHVGSLLLPSERQVLAQEILRHATQVAKAAGAFWGWGGVSKAEQTVLDRLAKTLTPG